MNVGAAGRNTVLGLSDNPAALEIARLNVDLMPPEQYDRYTALAGNEAKVCGGRGFKDYLRDFVQTPEYQSLSEAQGDYLGRKEELIKVMCARAKEAARNLLLEEFPELKTAYVEDRINKARAIVGAPVVPNLQQQ